MSVKQIIQEAVAENPLGLKEALAEELRTRVRLALEAKMKDEDDEEDDDEEDDDEDEDDDEVKEEVEQIDEISKKTLGSYVQKAVNDVRNMSAAKARGVTHFDRKAKNREAGVRLATDKLVGDTTWDYHKSGKKSDEYTMKPDERAKSIKSKNAPATVLNKRNT